MKHLKLLFGIFTFSIMITSCQIDDVEEPINLNNILNSNELWYVEINETLGNGEVPFLQKAFTVSFRNGILFANNNLVGIGTTGNGFGIDVGYYNTNSNLLDVSHDINGYWELEVFPVNNNKIEIYHRLTNTSYFLYGYNRNTFDYDLVFYENIQYFLQEYEAWEKVETNGGTPNDFDAEIFMQFLAGGNNNEFRSSQDLNGTPINNLFWDYTGLYDVANFTDTEYVKALTLDYDYFAGEYFELSIITDGEIEFYHPSSGTIYRFVGRNFIQYLRSAENKSTDKKRFKNILKDFHKESSKRKIKKV